MKKGLVSNVVIGEKVIRGDIKPEGIKEVLSAERLKELNEKDKEAKTALQSILNGKRTKDARDIVQQGQSPSDGPIGKSA